MTNQIKLWYFIKGEEEGILHRVVFGYNKDLDDFLQIWGGVIQVFKIEEW